MQAWILERSQRLLPRAPNRLEIIRQSIWPPGVVGAFELWQGARTTRAEREVRTLLDALEILPLDARAAELAGATRRLLLGQGEEIGVADSLVAGICLRQGGMLLTRNREHFEGVQGLQLCTLRPK